MVRNATPCPCFQQDQTYYHTWSVWVPTSSDFSKRISVLDLFLAPTRIEQNISLFDQLRCKLLPLDVHSCGSPTILWVETSLDCDCCSGLPIVASFQRLKMLGVGVDTDCRPEVQRPNKSWLPCSKHHCLLTESRCCHLWWYKVDPFTPTHRATRVREQNVLDSRAAMSCAHPHFIVARFLGPLTPHELAACKRMSEWCDLTWWCYVSGASDCRCSHPKRCMQGVDAFHKFTPTLVEIFGRKMNSNSSYR